ncbi:DUF423 domain-containing protein [Luteimonas aquatica]|uniref:DUF423 domain-containing protein n=1 Tax=Luteimonas aquatica TaxID=450364 RepID=UPI001F56FB6B|nr:DUF423 domain-containing protein [Luteimonas aquatica]
MRERNAGVRWLACAGALLAAAAVALSAYAAHGAEGAAQARLQTAAIFAFGHGVALAALARASVRGLAVIALAGLLCGTLLFSGALVLAELAGVHARTAPAGGSLLILAWLLYAMDALRK